MTPGAEVVDRLSEGLAAASYSYCSGSTHNFYHYPARFAADIARAIIEEFSAPGDTVLDPFMGGGTSVIEGLMAGRRVVGVDLNALASFVADVRTTPLSPRDEDLIRRWARHVALAYGGPNPPKTDLPGIVNLPRAVERFVAGGLRSADDWLPFPRQRAFARAALLRLGQWVMDCRDFVRPRRNRLGSKLPELVEEMLAGLREFVGACGAAGISKNAIRRHRMLLHRDAVGLETDPLVRGFGDRPSLVLTSPPYPRVHVLYHRWQYRGRKETPAPYWIADVPDGYHASHYTGGSRTPTGEQRYFRMIQSAFSSVRKLISPDGIVVQLIGFADAGRQLPSYLTAMAAAGFEEIHVAEGDERLRRRVPNRKWYAKYAKLRQPVDASCELVLFHRPNIQV